MMSACRLKHVEVENKYIEKSEKKCVKLVENPQLRDYQFRNGGISISIIRTFLCSCNAAV
jgi:hypothetical protein